MKRYFFSSDWPVLAWRLYAAKSARFRGGNITFAASIFKRANRQRDWRLILPLQKPGRPVICEYLSGGRINFAAV